MKLINHKLLVNFLRSLRGEIWDFCAGADYNERDDAEDTEFIIGVLGFNSANRGQGYGLGSYTPIDESLHKRMMENATLE